MSDMETNVYTFSEAEMERLRQAMKCVAAVAASVDIDVNLPTPEGPPMNLKTFMWKVANEFEELHRIVCERTGAANALYGPRPDSKP